MTDKPIEEAIDSIGNTIDEAFTRCKFCIITSHDIIGPFDSRAQARVWARGLRDASVDVMTSPEYEILCRADARGEQSVLSLLYDLSAAVADFLGMSQREGEETKIRRRRRSHPEAFERCKWCILIPDDVIGPFNSRAEASIWARGFRDETVKVMTSPEYEILRRADAAQARVYNLRDSLRKSQPDEEET
jgi:hypothetical protein